MTVLGKILVIVNLVFSLVTGAAIVAAYATRTNWKAGFDKMGQELKVAQANARAAEDSYREAELARGAAEKKQRDAETEAAKSRDTFLAEIDGLKLQMQKHDRNAQDADRNHRAALQEATARQDEFTRMRATMSERDKQIVQLSAEAKAQRDQKVAATMRAESEHERNKNLLTQIEAMTRKLEQAPSINFPNPAGRQQPRQAAVNPPAGDIEGSIKAVDTSGNLVTLNVGSDQGLSEGNTLFAFRFRPTAQYLGVIRIVNVTPHEAVGRPVSPLRISSLMVGDQVADKIGR